MTNLFESLYPAFKPIISRKIFFSAIFLLAILISCQDEQKLSDPPPGKSTDSGNGPVKTLKVDSIQVKTQKAQSVRTDNLSRNLIGTYYDSVFGQVQSQLFFDFHLPFEGLSDKFVNDRANNIDSAILSIPYDENNDHLGNLNTPQTIEFYELQEKLNPDKDYLSDANLSYDGSKVFAEKSGPFKINQRAHFKVKLKGAFVNKFENASSENFKNNEKLKAFFKGLAAIPQDNFQSNEKGAITYWQLKKGARIVFYHHNDLTDTLVVNDNSTSVGTYSLDHSNAIASAKPNPDYGFIQPMGGFKLLLQLPGSLKTIPEENRVKVHKATFTLPLSKKYHPKVVQPIGTLFMFNEDQGAIKFLDTANYRSKKVEYRFNNPTYLQRLLNAYYDQQTPNLSGLTVQIPNNLPVTANPLLIPKANKMGGKGVRMTLTYSKVR